MKLKLALLLIAAVVAAVALSSDAQIQDNECVQAKTWHLQQAMNWWSKDDQDFHLKAAQAADELSMMGGSPCDGWEDVGSQPGTAESMQQQGLMVS